MCAFRKDGTVLNRFLRDKKAYIIENVAPSTEDDPITFVDTVTLEGEEEVIEEPVENITDTELVPYIEGHAVIIRNQRVMLDRDLAKVYGVETRRLNEQRERNPDKFPEDFAFQFTPNEISQNAMLSGMKFTHPPWAYTLEGCNMSATVLNTPKAVSTNYPYLLRPRTHGTRGITKTTRIFRVLADDG